MSLKTNDILQRIECYLRALTSKGQKDVFQEFNRYFNLKRLQQEDRFLNICDRPCILDKIIVVDPGDLCKLEIQDGNLEVFDGYLDDQFLRMNLSQQGYTLNPKIVIENSLNIRLSLPQAVSHFKLNSITGSTAIDSGSLLNHATLVNMANDDWVQGIVKNALDFDGADDYINCGNNYNFKKSDPFSIAWWMYQHTQAGTQYVFAKRQVTSEKGYGCWIDNTGIIYFHMIGVPNTKSIITKSSTNLTLNDWEHYVFTYDGSANAEGMRFYRNRTQIPLIITDNDISGNSISTTDFNIGCMRGGGNPIDGVIDDFRIYDVELTPEQVSLIYNQGVGTEKDFKIGNVLLCYKPKKPQISSQEVLM